MAIKAVNTHVDYPGTPVPRKLWLITTKGGVAEVALPGEAGGLLTLLGELPETVVFHKQLRPSTKLAVAFVRSRMELVALLELLAEQLRLTTHLWIVHPKAHHKPDFYQNDLRNLALDAGLIDYKICSIDADWSRLKFAWRGQSRSAGPRMK